MTQNRPKYSYSQTSAGVNQVWAAPQTQATDGRRRSSSRLRIQTEHQVIHSQLQTAPSPHVHPHRGTSTLRESAHCAQLSTDVNNWELTLFSGSLQSRNHSTCSRDCVSDKQEAVLNKCERIWRSFLQWPQTDWPTSPQDGPSWTQNPVITLTRWTCRRL